METADAWRLTGRLNTVLGKGDPFAAAIRATRVPMVITDPQLDDNPIVFVNDAFCRLTGYERDEIMGRNCRFLQGADTDQDSVLRIRQAIDARTDIDIEVLNYRKDGSSFWNALYISPVFNESGEMQYFFASQLDVTDRREALAVQAMLLHEVDHRVKNNLQIVSSMLAMEARAMPDQAVAQRLHGLLARIEALSTVHRRLYQSDDLMSFDVAEFARDIVTNLVGSTGRPNIDVRLELAPAFLPARLAAPLALIFNELVTNTLKHAFPNGRRGQITVEVATADDQLRITVADDGAGLPDQPAGPASFGRKLIAALVQQLGATATWEALQPSGLRVDVQMPLGEDLDAELGY